VKKYGREREVEETVDHVNSIWHRIGAICKPTKQGKKPNAS
jgi:hypothetical protein